MLAGGNQISDAEPPRWVNGDTYHLAIPSDPDRLLDGGCEFLTEAFQASGALSEDNRVVRIFDDELVSAGGTGRKLRLRVEYQTAESSLPEELFVKFSRDFSDEVRDRGRFMMVSEANFATLSRAPGFPVPVPTCLFADVEAASATGLIVTECITYGRNGVEPVHPKCMDHLIDDPFEHYRAIVAGLARISGAHKAGRLAAELDELFPYDPEMVSAVVGVLAHKDDLIRWAHRMFAFIDAYPKLFAPHLRAPDLRDRFLADIPGVVDSRNVLRDVLVSNPDFVAFAHWNANIDNCWFERDAKGALRCGFIDWANAGPTNVAQSILGAISGAEAQLWRAHLDDLIAVFIEEYAINGGPQLDPDELRLHVLLLAAVSSLGFAMGAPVAIQREIGDVSALTGPYDDALRTHDNARVQLHMMTNLLENWQTFDLGDVVRGLSR